MAEKFTAEHHGVRSGWMPFHKRFKTSSLINPLNDHIR
jgi:hypothetical protein